MDFSTFSTDDLIALKTGDLSRVSDMGLRQYKRMVGNDRLRQSNPGEYNPESSAYKAKYGPTSVGNTFVEGVGKSIADLNRGAGQLFGVTSRKDVADARALDAPLMATGGGKAGNFAGAIGAAIPAMAIPGANTLAGAAIIGAGYGLVQPSESTGETLTNVGMGGVLSPAAMLAGRGLSAVYRGGKSLVEPLTQKGQQRIASRTMEAFAGGRTAAQQAADNIAAGSRDVLRGVQPTTAELSQNAGLAQLERSLKNNPEYTTAFADRSMANRNAMLGAVDRIAGDDGTRLAASAARESATKGLYQSATKANYAVDKELESLLQRPAVQTAMTRAKTLAENQGRPFAFTVDSANPFAGLGVPSQSSRQITGQGLQDLKMAMDEMLSDPTSGFTGKAGASVKDLRGQLVNWMERANPDFKAARTQYANLSRPLNQMDVGKALRDKLVPALGDAGQMSRLRPEVFANALRNGDNVATATLGRSSKMGSVFDPQQLKTLNQVSQQLARQANAADLGRAVGSNTGQNLVSQNVLRQFLGPLGLPESTLQRAAESTFLQTAMRPAQWAGKLGEQRAMGLLAESGLDPALAEQLLRAGVPPESLGLLKYQGLLGPAVSGAYTSR